MDDLISRQAAIAEFSCCQLTPDGGIDANYAIDFLKQLPPAQPEQLSTNLAEVGTDCISRQAAIVEIEYELEMINSALDSITLDFNARERLRQRRGEANEILNSIQQLPSAQPEIIRCKDCKHWLDIDDGRQKHRMCADVYGNWFCADAERREE